MNPFSIFLTSSALFAFSGLMFVIGQPLYGLIGLTATAASAWLGIYNRKRESKYTLRNFIKNHPAFVNLDENTVSCPHCKHDLQSCTENYQVTMGVHPFTRRNYDVRCAQCFKTLFIHTSKEFASTLELAKKSKPHKYDIRDHLN